MAGTVARIVEPGLERRLKAELAGEVLFDRFSRGRYATDASAYQQMPAGVVVPKTRAEAERAVAIALEEKVPVTARGGGTSQCGQTINTGLIVDCSRHLTAILDLDVSGRRAVVEPGIVLDELNRQLRPHGLWFPVDVSTASRATIGGMVGNNSCGGRSLRYGTTRDNVVAIDALLASGATARFGPVKGDLSDLSATAPLRPLAEHLAALGAREAAEIEARFPKVQRRVGGYNLDALVPASEINLAHVLVGSEGTLGFSTAIELKLWPLMGRRAVGACHFGSFHAAMDAAQHIVKLGPIAVELVDRTLLELASDIAMFRPTLDAFVRGRPEAILLVEFSEDDAENARRLASLHNLMGDIGLGWDHQGARWGGVVDVTEPALQAAIADVRTSGLNIMMSMKDQGKPVSFVEDCAVPLEHLADYTARLSDVFEKNGTRGTWYAHASVGCLHVRPVLNLRQDLDVKRMRAIAEEAFELVRAYKGSHSGEHGDGIVRSEFHEFMFGSRLVAAFGAVKRAFDPRGLLNPGKIVDAPKFDDRTLFRYGPQYHPVEVKTHLDWSAFPGASGGLQGAVEMCNNNGACRKLSGGTMCPSYRVTRDEKDVTRGRANTLRLALSGQLGEDALTSDEMMETLKLCVSCKGCRRECPTGVDMARFKIEALAARTARFGHSLRDRLVGFLPRYAPFAAKLPALPNLRDRVPGLAKLAERVTGFAAERALPRWRRDVFADTPAAFGPADGRPVILLADTFNRYFERENLDAALTVLAAAGYRVEIARPADGSSRPLCCGRTFLSIGAVDEAKREAQRVLDALGPRLKDGVPVIGLEPSCLLSFRDEVPALLPGPAAEKLAASALLFEEFLAREAKAGRLALDLAPIAPRALLHGHCHQKSFAAMGAVEQTLRLVPGLAVETVETSCCGMAGAFGYGTETVAASKAMAELALLPAVRAADGDTLVVADGTSCRQQIADGTPRQAVHVAQVLARAVAAAKARPALKEAAE
ncbi:FAD-binding and (Fe-S)-binding domain-containing protein [Xanthobacter tagetidis]|uniref:FAD-binding oxidoreductase n=1 Tax=Xanthobacter tagetidis TaxID=60216 RepID=A0A3L7AQG3_9HYPH|nr:FAD-binding and (Fe-S)-binding domain-containing protein [Xanthobacter tagetidis]RLP81891.1 FAD-binding oxidoreductase [Xanthobacter tagetidis]